MQQDICKAPTVDLNRIEDYKIATNGEKSRLDVLVQQRWRQKMELGYFRYHFERPECKKLPGVIGYLAQLNPNRASSRRPPEAMMSVKQPFQPEKFNFNKVDLQKELVFQVTTADYFAHFLRMACFFLKFDYSSA